VPNFENLKKQAKLYLRWHREGYYPIAAQIRSVLTRYRDLSDRQALACDFKLSDAQELVARKSGFESWQALKKGTRAMSASALQETAKPFLAAAEPQLFVADIKASCDFFTEKLGFAVGFVYGDPPFYGQVFRDGARLNLRHVDSPIFDAQTRAAEDLLSATIIVADIKPLFLQYQAGGVMFHQTLRTEPWGARTFIVADLDGNLIAFSGG
jgi:catechol 2,3-dioxygenase-like lactoylglutathione lyase family enzyme